MFACTIFIIVPQATASIVAGIKRPTFQNHSLAHATITSLSLFQKRAPTTKPPPHLSPHITGLHINIPPLLRAWVGKAVARVVVVEVEDVNVEALRRSIGGKVGR